MLNRLNRTIYYCYRLHPDDEGYLEGVEQFREPEKRMLHFRSVSGEAILLSGGEISEKRIVAKTSSYSKEKYFENDRLYIGINPPETFDPLDPRANYRIISVSVNPNVQEIVMERMV